MKYDDRELIKRRREFFDRHQHLGPDFAAENWPLLIGEVPLSTWLARYECLRMTLNLPGHVLEFGVFNGANLLYMAKMLRVLAPNDLKMLYGFDSWRGLTEFAQEDGISVSEQGAYAGDPELLRDAIRVYGLDGAVHLVDGLIEETLPQFLEQNSHHVYSLIYLDTDLYQSTLAVLEACWARVVPGGLVVFDEGYHDRFPGEGLAMSEFTKSILGEFDCGAFGYARQPMLWIRKR